MSDSVRIRKKLQQLAQLDRNRRVFGATEHRYQLRPCLDEAALLAFEAQHGVTLPEDYRAFLREVGDGGPGPYYGLYTLAESFESRWLKLGPLQESFPLDGITGGAGAAMYDDAAEDDDAPAEGSARQVRRGCLLIEHIGCGYFVLLIVSGSERGNIWYDHTTGGDGFKPAGQSFLAWYEEWLDRHLAELGAQEAAWQKRLRTHEAELAQNPEDPRPRVELAELLRQQNVEPERVRTLLEEAAARGGKDVRIWNHLCALARTRGDWKQLAEHAQTGLAMAHAQSELPQSAPGQFEYHQGVALAMLQRFPEAAELFQAALSHDILGREHAGRYLDVRTYFGWSLRQLKRYEEARQQLIYAPVEGASGAFVHRELGFIHAELGKLDKAADYYGRACGFHRQRRDFPALAAGLCAQAAVHVRRNDVEAAKLLYREVLSHLPDHAEASRALAKL